MTTSYISSLNIWNAPRTGLGRLQTDLATANTEIATGRYADVGLTLGTRAGTGLSLRQQGAEVAALRDGNGVASLRLKTTQSALAQMQASADKLLATIVGMPEAQRTGAVESGGSSLTPLVSALNMTLAGQYIFGGENAGAAPIDQGTLDALRQNLQADFQTHFGYAPGDPAAATESPAKMQAFLDAALDAHFTDTAWAATSKASGPSTAASPSTRPPRPRPPPTRAPSRNSPWPTSSPRILSCRNSPRARRPWRTRR